MRVFPNSFHDGIPHEQTISQIADAVNIVGAFAAGCGQQVRLEAHGNVGELPTLRAIMEQVTQPSVRLKLNSSTKDAEGEGFEHKVKMGWTGWQLLEVSDKVPDRVAALIEQREIWDRMLAKSMSAQT
ncbi:MAG: hypothetical protein ACYTE3_31575 [Planctomycetota bacterium]